MKKVNLSKFYPAELLARLMSIYDNYNRNFDILKHTPDEFKEYCSKIVKDNFICPPGKEEMTKLQIALYLLGQKSMFDKVLKD